jgi:hypothetical protein
VSRSNVLHALPAGSAVVPAKPSKPIKATLRLSREARHLLNFQAILLGTSYERSEYAECL